jgi:hypothetical protein
MLLRKDGGRGAFYIGVLVKSARCRCVWMERERVRAIIDRVADSLCSSSSALALAGHSSSIIAYLMQFHTNVSAMDLGCRVFMTALAKSLFMFLGECTFHLPRQTNP